MVKYLSLFCSNKILKLSKFYLDTGIEAAVAEEVADLVAAEVDQALETESTEAPVVFDPLVTKCCESNFFGDYFDPTAPDSCSCTESTAEEFEGDFCCAAVEEEESTANSDSSFNFFGIFDK